MKPMLRIHACCTSIVLGLPLLLAQAQTETPVAEQPGPEVDKSVAGVQVGNSMRVFRGGATMYRRDKSTFNAGRGTRLEVTKIRPGWIGGYATLGKERVPVWVQREDVELAPSDADIDAAIEQLTTLGVTIERDAHGRPYAASCEGAEIDDDDLTLFLPLVDLAEIDLSATGITDAGLAQIGKLTEIERLHLDQTGIGDKGLAAIAPLTRLSGLSLSDTKITDEGLAHLKGMTGLKVLNLGQTELTDAGLRHLKNLKGIETLTLSRTNINGSGFKFFADYQDLITLNLDDCELEEGTLKNFEGLTKIRILRMYDTTAPDDDIESLEEAVDGLAIFR